MFQWIKALFIKSQSLFYIGRHDVLKAPLKGQEEHDALLRLQNGDLKARDELIEHNLRLVVYVAKKYDNVSMACLSMGMTDDFTDAIANGSTMIRVGTAIFGARHYGNQ